MGPLSPALLREGVVAVDLEGDRNGETEGERGRGGEGRGGGEGEGESEIATGGGIRVALLCAYIAPLIQLHYPLIANLALAEPHHDVA